MPNKENETKKIRLSNKIAQLFQESKTVREEEHDKLDVVAQYKKELKADAIGSKIAKFYVRVMGLIPEEKKKELHARFVEEYKNTIGESKYNLFMTMIKADTHVLTTPEMKENFLFYRCPADMIKHGLYEKFLVEAVNEIDGEKLEKVVREIDDFRAPETNNIPVYYWKDKIEKIKQENRNKELDPTLLEALDKELDVIANTVIVSSEEYSKAQDVFDRKYETKNNKKDDAILETALQKEEYRHVEEYFSKNGNGLHNCLRDVKEEQQGNPEIYKAVHDEKLRFDVPKKTQDSLRKIIGFMQERGMIQKGYGSREDGSKAYGFRQIALATIALESAIQTTDLARIQKARADYEQSLENMREVYKMIEEEFAPGEDVFVGNINSYREPWVPAEFKNNIIYNALASGIYNLALNLENNDVSLDELFENPNKAFMNIISKSTEEQSPNGLLKKNSLGNNMLAILNNSLNPTYPMVAVARNVDLLLRVSANEQNRERNTVATMFLQSYDKYADNNTRTADGSSFSGYALKNVRLTLANIFLVNEEDRNYDNLRAFESYTANGERRIPPFDTFGYVQTHKIDPTELVSRIQSTINEIMSMENLEGQEKNIAQIIQSAQFSAFEYLSVHTTPDAGYDEKSYDALKEMIENPKKAFEQAFKNQKIQSAVEKRTPMQDFIKDVKQKGKDQIKTLRKNARTAEKEYNKSVNALTKAIARLTQNIEKGKDVENARQELEMKKTQLGQLKTAEVHRLNDAYCKGEMPKDYFEKRKWNVENEKHDEQVAFGVDEYPTFRKFKKMYADDIKNGELTNEDVEFFYQRMMETAQIEENKLFLINAKIQRFPTLEENSEEVVKNAVVEERKPIEIPEMREEQPQQVSQIVPQNSMEKTVEKNV